MVSCPATSKPTFFRDRVADPADRKRHNKPRTFRSHVHNVLLNMGGPKVGISTLALTDVLTMINDVATRLSQEAANVTRQNGGETINDAAIRAAVRLIMKGQVRDQAVSQGEKAVRSFATTAAGNKDAHNGPTLRANLQFAVSIAERFLRQYRLRLAKKAAVYLAAVLEYIATEILELAKQAAIDDGRKRISSRHLTLAVRADKELSALFPGTISRGGVLPTLAPKCMATKPKARVAKGSSNKASKKRSSKKSASKKRSSKKSASKKRSSKKRSSKKRSSKKRSSKNTKACASKKKPVKRRVPTKNCEKVCIA